jgi:hypothetical protein
LDMVTLKDLVKGNCGLESIMSLGHPGDMKCITENNIPSKESTLALDRIN